MNIKKPIELNHKAEQYYPTYKVLNPEALLVEFEEAQKIANGQVKVYGQITSILLAILAILIPLFLGHNSIVEKSALDEESMLISSITVFLFGAFILRYFVELQRQITINARKVVTLRTLLNLDYGSIHLTLPNNRVEGASNPFLIKYFNGWSRFESVPFWVLVFGVNVIWWLTAKDLHPFLLQFTSNIEFYIPFYFGNMIIFASYILIFRTSLNDRHESNYLNIVKLFAKLFYLKLMGGIEEILYHAKLSYIELDRLGVQYMFLRKILIDIEDKSFYKNSGFSAKSIFRGILSQIPFIRKKYALIESGGSTITMQLARSLFIPANQNKFKRKIFELLLSIWLTKQFTKKEILQLYIASVRYEKGVLGLSSAIKYFFGDIKSKNLSMEECFFLVERLSNVTSTVNFERIEFLLTRTELEVNKDTLVKLYNNQIASGRLRSKTL